MNIRSGNKRIEPEKDDPLLLRTQRFALPYSPKLDVAPRRIHTQYYCQTPLCVVQSNVSKNIKKTRLGDVRVGPGLCLALGLIYLIIVDWDQAQC